MSEYSDPHEYQRMMQYWQASCPSRFMILPYQPRFACKCGERNWGSTTGFDWQTPSARIWSGESVCLSCQGMTRWLLDSDVPFEHQTEAMHRPIGSDATKPMSNLPPSISKENLRNLLDKLKEEQEMEKRFGDLPYYDKDGNIILPPQSDYDNDAS